MKVTVLSGVISGLCALLMFGIGIFQIRSGNPVGFWSGEKAPDVSELSDVYAWNKKHGAMWILYGICIIPACVCGFIFGDSLLLLIPLFICLLLPIPFMILYHHKLVKKYYIVQNTDFKSSDSGCRGEKKK